LLTAPVYSFDNESGNELVIDEATAGIAPTFYTTSKIPQSEFSCAIT
jgi:hypothetical protein